MVGRTLIVLALFGCHHDAPAPAPRSISNTVRIGAADAQCEDEPIGTLHSTDASYLVSPDELVARALGEHLTDLKRCFLHFRPEHGSKLVVTIHLDAAGKPTLVQTRGPDADIDRCICAKVLALTFGLASSTVSVPLYFAAP
jgi:hypothetical protein